MYTYLQLYVRDHSINVDRSICMCCSRLNARGDPRLRSCIIGVINLYTLGNYFGMECARLNIYIEINRDYIVSQKLTCTTVFITICKLAKQRILMKVCLHERRRTGITLHSLKIMESYNKGFHHRCILTCNPGQGDNSGVCRQELKRMFEYSQMNSKPRISNTKMASNIRSHEIMNLKMLTINQKRVTFQL